MKKHLPSIASILAGVIPIVILIVYFDVPRKLIIGYGILSWIIGVGLFKMPVYHLVVVKFLHGRLSNKWLGITQGLVSAFSELGSALIFFHFVLTDLSLPQLIGFGLAAGAVESVILPFIGNPFTGTPLEKHTADMEQKMSLNLSMQWMGVLERLIAMVIHIASRGLIYVSMITFSLLPGIIAVVTFAAVDGRGYYALQEKWAFDNIKVLKKFYLFLAIIALLQSVSFLFFSYKYLHLLKF
ncbi:MAG: hypothetical protein Q8M08_06070 [Bacteroidales bacterium]|nr:hypothetical protein [Bacteroidales bacterium]